MITTTPFAAREPYIAVAEASFNIWTFSTRIGSISYTFCTLTSKPSMIKIGRFGLFFKEDLDNASLSSSFTPIPERPRIYISGIAFGSDPHLLFCCIRNDGSNVDNACTTFVADAFNKSSRFTEIELPVKLSFLILPYPVTTTSSISFTSSFIVITSSFSSFFRSLLNW